MHGVGRYRRKDCFIANCHPHSLLLPTPLFVDRSPIHPPVSLHPLHFLPLSHPPFPPLFPQADVDRSKAEIASWSTSKEAKQGDKCPFVLIPPVLGKTFEYDYAPHQFKTAVLKVFDTLLGDFQEVPHVQKFVMEKVYFPTPKYIPSVSPTEPWVVESRGKISSCMDTALAPLEQYLQLFSSYEEVLNVDHATYVGGKIGVLRSDPESTEIELPVTVDLGKVGG